MAYLLMEVAMVSLILGILRAKAFLVSLFLILISWWARRQGKVDAKIEYVAKPVISRKKKQRACKTHRS